MEPRLIMQDISFVDDFRSVLVYNADDNVYLALMEMFDETTNKKIHYTSFILNANGDILNRQNLCGNETKCWIEDAVYDSMNHRWVILKSALLSSLFCLFE